MTPTMDMPVADGGRAFHVELRVILDAVRIACAEVIAAVSAVTDGPGIGNATDLQKALEIPTTLAWQVFRVGNAREPLEETSHVPGVKAIGRFTRAARAKGVQDLPLHALTLAIQRFEGMVRSHAGDRRTFNAIVAGLGDDRNGHNAELASRRSAFQANSQIWGQQVRTRLATFIVHPATPDHADVLAISGSIDLCRLHGAIPYELARTAILDTTSPDKPSRIVALGRPLASYDLAEHGSTLLTEFGSQPPPIIRDSIDQNGQLVVELDSSDVGRRNTVSAFVAVLYHSGVPRFCTPKSEQFETLAFVPAPIETWITDLLIAPGVYWPPPRMPEPFAYMVANVRARMIGLEHVPVRHAREILARPSVVHMGLGPHVLETTDVPRYPEMVEHVCRRLGWDPAIFHAYRCRVEYPVMSSSIMVGFDLPRKPEARHETASEPRP